MGILRGSPRSDFPNLPDFHSNVDGALLLTCKLIRNEGQMLYDGSIRFSLAYETAMDDCFTKVYARDFYKRITWLSISVVFS